LADPGLHQPVSSQFRCPDQEEVERGKDSPLLVYYIIYFRQSDNESDNDHHDDEVNDSYSQDPDDVEFTDSDTDGSDAESDVDQSESELGDTHTRKTVISTHILSMI
jgi:hypothetical protein